MASWTSGKILSVLLLCLGFYQFPTALGTTVIPICGSNETDNCTTALVKTEHSPHLAQVKTKECKSELQNYCFHGQCVQLVDVDKYYCQCDKGYIGPRCGIKDLNSEYSHKLLSLNESVVLTVVLILFFIIAASVATYYFYRWYQNKKAKGAGSGNYTEVVTDPEKDPKLLPV